jgi:cell division inhibitor SepF
MRGSIERVTTKVFLLSPANVDVGSAARAQMRGDGFFNQS